MWCLRLSHKLNKFTTCKEFRDRNSLIWSGSKIERKRATQRTTKNCSRDESWVIDCPTNIDGAEAWIGWRGRTCNEENEKIKNVTCRAHRSIRPERDDWWNRTGVDGCSIFQSNRSRADEKRRSAFRSRWTPSGPMEFRWIRRTEKYFTRETSVELFLKNGFSAGRAKNCFAAMSIFLSVVTSHPVTNSFFSNRKWRRTEEKPSLSKTRNTFFDSEVPRPNQCQTT